MRLGVHSRVPRNAPGDQTQDGKSILPGEAGKPVLGRVRRLVEAVWLARDEADDPWANCKAGRWMGQAGQTVVRAGLLAWKEVEKGSNAGSRGIGILVVGVEGSWPEWLEGKSPTDIAALWRSKPPLWLLECLPNLPAAQLAIEIGAKGPVESRRSRPDDEETVRRTLERWQRRGVRAVLVVRSAGEMAKAEVWEL
jgi:hypothetical protein